MLRFLPLLIIALMALPASAQTLTVQEGSTLEIDGSSNKSDWTVKASSFAGTFEMAEGSVVSAEFVVDATTIKGESGVIQDRLITRALKTPANPEIRFVLSEVAGSQAVDGGLLLATKGTLEIAGVEQEVEMDVLMAAVDGGVRFTGSQEVSMTDYRIQPPKAMFGALVVSKDVTVRFDVLAGGVPAGD
ncbi:MAG: YceI family protein [Rhodothermales bacterium]|nr:YceI family protein [Rhodothermales bacterium]MBO6779905.1 YceI family protein [Rhodothermales bacterium]